MPSVYLSQKHSHRALCSVMEPLHERDFMRRDVSSCLLQPYFLLEEKKATSIAIKHLKGKKEREASDIYHDCEIGNKAYFREFQQHLRLMLISAPYSLYSSLLGTRSRSKGHRAMMKIGIKQIFLINSVARIGENCISQESNTLLIRRIFKLSHQCQKNYSFISMKLP